MKMTEILSRFSQARRLGTMSLLNAAVFALCIAGCGYNYDSAEFNSETNTRNAMSDSTALTPEEIQNANFQTIKDNVFTPHCLKCHASDVRRGDVNLEDYASAFALANQIRIEVEADRMPRRAPPLSAELKTLLFSWIDRGAPEL